MNTRTKQKLQLLFREILTPHGMAVKYATILMAAPTVEEMVRQCEVLLTDKQRLMRTDMVKLKQLWPLIRNEQGVVDLDAVEFFMNLSSDGPGHLGRYYFNKICEQLTGYNDPITERSGHDTRIYSSANDSGQFLDVFRCRRFGHDFEIKLDLRGDMLVVHFATSEKLLTEELTFHLLESFKSTTMRGGSNGIWSTEQGYRLQMAIDLESAALKELVRIQPYAYDEKRTVPFLTYMVATNELLAAIEAQLQELGMGELHIRQYIPWNETTCEPSSRIIMPWKPPKTLGEARRS